MDHAEKFLVGWFTMIIILGCMVGAGTLANNYHKEVTKRLEIKLQYDCRNNLKS